MDIKPPAAIRALPPAAAMEDSALVERVADVLYRFNNPFGKGAGKTLYIAPARAVVAAVKRGV